MAIDNYDPSRSLAAYFPERDERRLARLWAREKVLHDFADLGAVEFFEGSGSDPTQLDGYATDKLWLRVESGVTDEPGEIRYYSGGDATLLASWPILTREGFASHLGARAGAEFDYVWSAETSGDPGTGKVRGNHATLASITELALSKTGRQGQDYATRLLAWLPGDTVRVYGVGAESDYVDARLDGAPADQGDYVTIACEVITSSTLADGQLAGVAHFPTREASAEQFAQQAAASAQAAAQSASDAADYMNGAGEITGALPRVALAALKALDTSDFTVAYLTDAGREGMFLWRTGDYSTEVAADPEEGVYLKADDVAATSGAWVRVFLGSANVKWFGAVGDGSTDDADAIQAANDLCEVIGAALFFPPGDYVAKAKLQISCPWYSFPRNTTIKLPSDFVPSGGDNTELNIGIKNKSFGDTFDDGTANYVDIRGLDFVIEYGPLTLLRLGNVRGGVIEHCRLMTNTSSQVSALLDLFACVKNFTARKCTFNNDCQYNGGGGAVWIRNVTTAGNDETNNTEHVLFDECDFSTTTVDEAVAVYGVRGKTRNVTIRKSTIRGGSSPVRHGTLASTFPLNDGYTIGGVSYAAIEGVLWDDCTFIDDNFSAHVLRFGRDEDAAQPMSDVKARNCRLLISKSVAGTSYAVRAIRCVGHGLSAQHCHVVADGSIEAITYGFGGLDLVTGCTTSGNIGNGVSNCEVAVGNPRLAAATGAFNCARIHGNRIYATAVGVSLNGNAEYIVLDNYIESDDIGIIFNSLGGATQPSGEVVNNRIVMSSASSFALQASGATGRLRARGNRVSGTGKTIGGSTWAEVSGNDWYGTLDAVRSAGYIDFDHNGATPVGTFTSASSPTAGESRILLGWIKKGTAGNSSDWQAVYPETENN